MRRTGLLVTYIAALAMPAAAVSSPVDDLKVARIAQVTTAPAVSEDGTYLTVVVGDPGDTNNDCFLLNRKTGVMDLISRNSAGGELNQASICFFVSGGGRLVQYFTMRGGHRSYFFDRKTRKTIPLDRCPNGKVNPFGSAISFLNREGTAGFATYTTWCEGVAKPHWALKTARLTITGDTVTATPFLPARIGGFSGLSIDGKRASYSDTECANRKPCEVMILDTVSGKSSIATVDASGNALGARSFGRITPDGTAIVFDSDSGRLVPGDYNERTDVFLRNLATGKAELISVAVDGKLSNGSSTLGHLVGDFADVDNTSRFVFFRSNATNLTEVEIRGTHCYLRDRQARKTYLVDKDANGVPSDTGCSPYRITSNPLRLFFGAGRIAPSATPGLYVAEAP
jgi:hypothetical protein